MLKKDNIWLGAFLGMVLPAIAYFFVEVIKKNFVFMKKDDLLYIGCIALNMFLVRYFFSHDKENTARGVISSTFICAFIFFYHKVRQ